LLTPFFFGTAGERLLGVLHGAPAPARVFVICPPFAEEEKSARRTLTEIALMLQQNGDGALLFSYRGTGDSEGDFATVTLEEWRADVKAAVFAARQLYPAARVELIGVRLGASLALQVASALAITGLILIEPLLSGRSYLAQQSARKRLRANLTSSEGGAASAGPAEPQDVVDLDGWPLGPALKADLEALDLRGEVPVYRGNCVLLGVGPRTEVSAPLSALAQELEIEAQAVVMPPFWNLLDYTSPQPLLGLLHEAVYGAG
jgi:alpha/beta superfamily hydrolase